MFKRKFKNPICKKNLLIVGASGCLGKNFVAYLTGNPNFKGKIVVLDRKVPKDAKDTNQVTHIAGDCKEECLLDHIVCKNNIDHIVDFAAETDKKIAQSDPERFIRDNLKPHAALLKWIRKNPTTPMHFISSGAVYEKQPRWSGPFKAESPMITCKISAVAKILPDKLVQAARKEYNLNITTSRCGSHFYGKNLRENSISYKLIKSCLGSGKIKLAGNGKQKNSWLDIDDHSEFLFKLLSKQKNAPIYLLNGKKELTDKKFIDEVIKIAARLQNKPLKNYHDRIELEGDKTPHPRRRKVDDTAARKILKWTPTIKFRKSLAITVKYVFDREAEKAEKQEEE